MSTFLENTHTKTYSHVEALLRNSPDSVWVLSLCKVALLFSLWTETVRPYLEIVDEWIVHGHLFDPAKEFIIQRYVITFFSFLKNRLHGCNVLHSQELTDTLVQE